MDKDKPTTLLTAMRDFFGLRPGTTLTDFAAEVKALTPHDREEIKAGLIANGYKIS